MCLNCFKPLETFLKVKKNELCHNGKVAGFVAFISIIKLHLGGKNAFRLQKAASWQTVGEITKELKTVNKNVPHGSGESDLIC